MIINSAVILGGSDHGQLATWALPGFSGSVDPVHTPGLAAPINEATVRLGFAGASSLASTHTTAEWLQFDGALASQRCALEADRVQ